MNRMMYSLEGPAPIGSSVVLFERDLEWFRRDAAKGRNVEVVYRSVFPVSTPSDYVVLTAVQ
jgi:hypothetical protein